MMQLWRQCSSSPCHSSATSRQCSRVPLAFSPSSCWHGLSALKQYLVESYREDSCAGWELLEYMVNAVAFVLSGVYMMAKLRSSDTGGCDVLTCSTVILSAQPSGLYDSLLLCRDEACGSPLRLARRRSVVGRRFEGCCGQGKGRLLHLLLGKIGQCVWILVSNFSRVPKPVNTANVQYLSCRCLGLG